MKQNLEGSPPGTASADQVGAPDRFIAPLPAEAGAVLRALALGLDLRRGQNGWTFVGPFQRPQRSGVSADALLTLVEAGFIDVVGGCARVTHLGGEFLRTQTKAMVRECLSASYELQIEH